MFRKKPTPTRRQPTSETKTNVFSYYSSRSGVDTSRARYEPPATQRRGIERLKHLPTVIALLVILSMLAYTSLLNAKPRVLVVASSTGKSVQRPTQVYEAFIQKELTRSSLNKSKLTFSSGDLEDNLRRQFPEVANVVVTLPLIGHRPIVHVAVSSPAFILATSSGAYYMNNRGEPLVRVAEVKNPLPGLIAVTDESGVPITTGKQVLPEATVRFIAEVITYMDASDKHIQALTLPTEANELRMRTPNSPYFVRFNTNREARVQVGTLLAVENKLKNSGEIPEEYIDVRVEERAYYR